MKRAGNLLDRIADMDNLRLAFLKAKRGKSSKEGVLNYQANLESNLQALHEQLLNGTLDIGHYHTFKVYDPKERLICAAAFKERVLHHALMNVCHEHFENKQIFHSYASRKRKGVHAAIKQAQQYSQQYDWYLKLDVRKFFDSIHHDVLKTQLAKLFKDEKLLAIFYQIIDSYEASSERGVPIGNLTSQYFSNHYLAQADAFAKENLHIKPYIRYMDDIVFWHNNKEKLVELGKAFEAFALTHLRLSLKPYCLNKAKEGLPFLGFLIFPNTIRLAKRSKRRFIKKIKILDHELEKSAITQKDFQIHATCLVAFTQHADALGFRRKVFGQHERSPTLQVT